MVRAGNGRLWAAFILVAALLAACACAALALDDGRAVGETWLDVDYVGDGVVGHRMDIYAPSEGTGPFPAVIMVYGSAWSNDDGKGVAGALFAPSLCAAGLAAVSINHRASWDAIFPAQIHDVKAAIRFIRADATTYNIDPERIGIVGGSSGGHLAALAGTSGAVGLYTVGEITMDLEGSLGDHVGTSSSVKSVVAACPPTDFLILNSCGSHYDHDAPESHASRLIGGPIQENPEMCRLANPVTYVDPTDPPFAFFHGALDTQVPVCQSAVLSWALLLAGVPVEYTIVDGVGHNNVVTPMVQRRIVEFFVKTLLEEGA